MHANFLNEVFKLTLWLRSHLSVFTHNFPSWKEIPNIKEFTNVVPVSYLAILSQFRDSIKQLFIFLYKSTSKMSPL